MGRNRGLLWWQTLTVELCEDRHQKNLLRPKLMALPVTYCPGQVVH
jgi:hypothetical protein